MKPLSSLFLLFVLGVPQNFAQVSAFQSPSESRPYFSVESYPDGLNVDSMRQIYDLLENRQKILWKNKDSLDFLFASIAIGEYDAANVMFKKRRKLLPRNLEELHLVQYLYAYKRRYDQLQIWLDYEISTYSEHRNIVEFRSRIHKVEDLILSNHWSTKDSLIFPELSFKKWKGVKRGDPRYRDELIPLLHDIDSALRIETKYEFSSNVTLARAFYEFGNFVAKYVSLSDAFVAMAIAQYYDAFNSEISQKFRAIRSKMNTKGYAFPSIRRLFPKQSKGYFSIESIEKRRLARADTLANQQYNPETLRKAEVKSTVVITDLAAFLLVFVGAVVLLIYVALFVKTES